MKALKTIITTLSILLLAMTAGTGAADNSAHVQQVETLFRLTQMEQKVNEGIDNIMQLQMGQSPQLARHKEEIRAFFERQIGWAALKNDITQMYLRTFTEEELKAINDFYITPVGQKVITAVPELVQERNQLAMMRLQQNIGELERIVSQPAAQ